MVKIDTLTVTTYWTISAALYGKTSKRAKKQP